MILEESWLAVRIVLFMFGGNKEGRFLGANRTLDFEQWTASHCIVWSTKCRVMAPHCPTREEVNFGGVAEEAEMEKKKSRVLIVGVTGNLGHEQAKASLNFSHPTFALVRETAFADPNKLINLNSLSDAGVTLLKGSLQDEENLMEAIRKVDVVICAVNSTQVLDQKLLIQVIKKAGSINVTTFFHPL